ncbi:MAG: hypothetical protein RLZZ33_1370 [Pseudomonadota bacterium]|jgi:hypothetical protein
MDWLKKRLVEPLLNLLRQGLAPRDLALCVALGVGVGLFPVLGVSTPALTVLALTLRLNLAAIQLVSYAIAPLQLALIIPFMRLGEIVLGSKPQPMTISAAMELLTEGVLFAIVTLWDAIIHATLGWLLIVPVLIFVSYKILVPILLRLSTTLRPEKP